MVPDRMQLELQGQPKAEVLKFLRSELERVHNFLRVAPSYEEMLRGQGKAQFIYGVIRQLDAVKSADTRKEGEIPNATTGY